MATSLFRFSEVEAKTAKPLVVNQLIKDILKADSDSCYVEMEKFLMPPGVTGSKSFDQAYAVSTLIKHDAMQEGLLAAAMESTSQLTHRLLWDRLQHVLRSAGFSVSHGRLVGVISPPEDRKSDGQPDID